MKHNLELRRRRLLAGPRVMRTATTFAWALAVALCSQPVSAATLTVTNLNDNGPGSLRQMILVSAPGDTIEFFGGGTIELTSGELAFGKSLTIVGPTASGVTVSGNQASRVFQIYGGVVSLANLTIANGNTAIYGAGFFNGPGATLVLNNCTVSGNTSGDSGGGIANNGSVLATNCTFSGNRALQGGGIYTYAGSVLLRNCTVCSNIATTVGGGLYDYGIAGSEFTVGSTVVARNTAVAAAPDVLSNPSVPFISLGYNLIGNGDLGYGFTNGVNQDQVGSAGSPLNPLLGPLQHNGGPMFSHALLSGSPAIDRGNSHGSRADQRGRLRPFDFASIANASGGDGSDIGAFELQPAPLFLMGPVKSGNDIVVSFSSELGQQFRIERKDTLAPGAWTTVADNVPGTGGIVPVTDPGGASQRQRFYRGSVITALGLRGDLNGDRCVDQADLDILTVQIRARSTDLNYDLNSDGTVDIADARWLVLHFTNPGGAPCP